MQSLLHWAIQNSDAGVLKDLADKVRALDAPDKSKPKYTREELLAMRNRLKSLDPNVVDQILQPPGAKEMKTIAEQISMLNATDAELVDALSRLQYLVEDIDNAGDLLATGGLKPVTELLEPRSPPRDPEVATLAAHVIGTASSSLPKVQQQMLEHGGVDAVANALRPAMSMPAGDDRSRLLGKLLFAVSALARDNEACQKRIQEKLVFKALFDCLKDDDTKLLKKVVSILADFANAANERKDDNGNGIASLNYLAGTKHGLLIAQLGKSDAVLREKTLLCIQALAKAGDRDIAMVRAALKAVKLLWRHDKGVWRRALDDSAGAPDEHLQEIDTLAGNVIAELQEVLTKNTPFGM
jgi:hypothetical protein